MPKKNCYIIGILIVLICILSYLGIKNLSLRAKELRKDKLTKELSQIEELYQSGELNDVTLRNYVNVYFDLARLYLEKKDFDKAILSYERGLQIDSWRLDKIFELGCAYKGKGLYKDAYERFKQILGLKPPIITWLRAKWELWRINKKIKDYPEEQKLLISEGKLKDLMIYILPFGVKDREMLEDLKVLLQDIFKVQFGILNPLSEPAAGFDKERNQYFVEPLFKYISQEYESVFFVPGTQAIMIVTSFDITGKGLNFVFGHTEPQTRLGIVSYYRFLLDRPDDKLLFKRLYTQSLSTAGFLFGIPRCSIPGCARSYPHSLAEFKRKSYKLCKECQSNLNKLLEKLKDYPEVDWNTEDLARLKKTEEKYNLQ